jgi:Domain of unknown function (DUF4382)
MRHLLFSLGLIVLALSGCKKEEEAKINIRMTDGPANYNAVNIDLLEVRVHVGGDTASADGWVTLNTKPGIFNLLELANGLDTLIGQGNIPVGKLTQIRLNLGSKNTILVDSVSYPLDVVANNTLKIIVNQDIKAGETYTFLLDFDAGKSIVETGNKKYKLKPVVKIIDATKTGVIKGVIDPASCRSYVSAVDGAKNASTYTHRKTGYFSIQGVEPGIYLVVIEPSTKKCASKLIQSVTVEAGKAVDLGKIKL